MHHRIVLHHVHIMLGSSPHDVPQLHMYKYTVSAFVPEFFLKLYRILLKTLQKYNDANERHFIQAHQILLR